MSDAIPIPAEGDIWRASNGAERIVVDVEDDAFWVMYRRPAPAPFDAITVRLEKWTAWVEKNQAKRMARK